MSKLEILESISYPERQDALPGIDEALEQLSTTRRHEVIGQLALAVADGELGLGEEAA